MYATCLFCNKSLGANESFELFPVGKRLAFDTAKGRLWVVCPHCERWNLTPVEERWETIEQAERLYRDTRTRVATDNIGLAKLRDGTTIVRIGSPLRPEFAAWRYGDQFGRRRNRQLLIAGGGIALLGGVVIGGMTVAGGIGGMAWMISRVGAGIINGSPETVVARIPTDLHGVVSVRRRHLKETSIDRADDGSMAINLRFKNGQARFEGREAQKIAAIVIPKVNRFGGSKRDVADAVAEIEREGSPESYLRRLTQMSQALTRPSPADEFKGWSGIRTRRRGSLTYDTGLFGLPTTHRLALEMALHEEAERRALEGELAELERAWKDAEEIAGISDSLLIPPTVDEAFDAIKKKR
jgi:hypothetical protein